MNAASRLRRRLAVAFALAFLAGALGPPAAVVAAQPERPLRTIALYLNGEALDTDTPPQVVRGHLLLPLRPIFEALGIPLTRDGATLTARLPAGSVSMTLNSMTANVNGKVVTLDVPAVEIGGTAYVSLRLLNAALGATATYDQRASRVELVSGLLGRATGFQARGAGGGSTFNGIVSAVDTLSAPPAITLVQGGQSHTINVNSDAKIYLEDATVHSQVVAQLAEIHVGDHLTAILSKDGRVIEMHDVYASDNGTIAAVSPGAIVLQNGKVVQPGKATQITLNGTAAVLGDLVVGDYVTVRRNPESGEIRQILDSRAGGATATAQPVSNDLKVTGFTVSATRPLHAGESLDVTLLGTPGAKGTFDIGDYFTGLPLREDPPGTYKGKFTVPDRFNVNQVPIYARLSGPSGQSPRAESSNLLSAATSPPQIPEVAPSNGATVNNPRPSMYATFVTKTQVPINQSTITISVNGHDVTSAATRSAQFITYMPGVDYPDGEIKVIVRVSDAAGNSASRSWSFFIKTK